MGVAGKGGGAGAVGLEWKKTCHQLRIIKQKFVNPVQHLRTSRTLSVPTYLGRHGLLKGDFGLQPNTPWGLQHRPDLLLNHMVLLKNVNCKGVSHF